MPQYNRSDLSGKVLTVKGPIEPSQLGKTICHEHLFIDFRVVYQDPPSIKDIKKSLEKVQNRFKDVEIGSYPFFRLGRIGVSIVMRSTNKNRIDECSKQIVDFIKKRKIEIVER